MSEYFLCYHSTTHLIIHIMTDIAVEVVTHRSRYQINAGQLQRRWVIPAGDPTVAIVHKAQIAVTSYIESPPKRFKSVFQTSM